MEKTAVAGERRKTTNTESDSGGLQMCHLWGGSAHSDLRADVTRDRRNAAQFLWVAG
jgi:hypothetical protein